MNYRFIQLLLVFALVGVFTSCLVNTNTQSSNDLRAVVTQSVDYINPPPYLDEVGKAIDRPFATRSTATEPATVEALEYAEFERRLVHLKDHFDSNIDAFESREVDLFGYSSEGAHLTGRFDEKMQLIFLSIDSFGETGKSLIECYFDTDSVFIVSTNYRYKQHIFEDPSGEIVSTETKMQILTPLDLYSVDANNDYLIKEPIELFNEKQRFIEACINEFSSPSSS